MALFEGLMTFMLDCTHFAVLIHFLTFFTFEMSRSNRNFPEGMLTKKLGYMNLNMFHGRKALSLCSSISQWSFAHFSMCILSLLGVNVTLTRNVSAHIFLSLDVGEISF